MYSDSDDDYGILKKALDVEIPENFDPTKIPTNGEEYIQLVMYEAKQCKPWVTADIDTSKFHKNQTVKIEDVFLKKYEPPKPSSEKFLPTKEWQTEKIKDFLNFQKFIQSTLTEETQTTHFIHRSHWIEKVKTDIPTLTQIITLTQMAKIKLFNIILDDIEELKDDEPIPYITQIWLYGLMAAFEVPFTADLHFYLRRLSKICFTIRSKLSENATSKEYLPLNLFICIVAHCYYQKDLSD